MPILKNAYLSVIIVMCMHWSHLHAQDEAQKSEKAVAENSSNPIAAADGSADDPQKKVLESITVFPSTYNLNRSDPDAVQLLTRAEIREMPHIADDLYRTVAALPGVSGNDISAQFNIRGGTHDEVLVLLDGMELYEPFHLKDFTGVLSVVDPEAIGGLELSTGGFSAAYGRRASGVLNLHTAAPRRKQTTGILSFSNAGVLSEGTFADGLGSYLVSARRGYLDILLDLAEADDDETLSPSYYDSLGKVQYSLNANQALSFNYLLAEDTLKFDELDEGEEADTEYGSLYLWVGLTSTWSDALSSRATLYRGAVDSNRRASKNGFFTDYSIADTRDFKYYGIKQDWSYNASARALFQFGFDLRRVSADYDYFSHVVDDQALLRPRERLVDLDLSPSGEEYSAYVSTRRQLAPGLVGELGLRYDHQSIVEEDQVSPRLNLAYEISSQLSLRAAAGRFHQQRDLNKLQIEDGVTAFRAPEYADQYLLSMNYQWDANRSLRIETYHKRLGDLQARYENMFDPLRAFPELEDDRIVLNPQEGTARGVEFIYKQSGRSFSFLGHYTFAKAEDEINGQKISKRLDQRHSIGLNLTWRHNRTWTSAFNWVYHSGLPTTSITLQTTLEEPGFQIEQGPLYGERFPAYHRLDYRLNYHLSKRTGRGFTLYLDITNVYDRENPRGFGEVEVVTKDGQPVLRTEMENWLPRLPSLGITWKF